MIPQDEKKFQFFPEAAGSRGMARRELRAPQIYQ